MNTADRLTQVLNDFGIQGSVVNTVVGPRVTRYDIKLGQGTKVRRVTSLKNEVAMGVLVPYVRILPLPEAGVVGIEVPNPVSKAVDFDSLVGSVTTPMCLSYLPLIIGCDAGGQPIVVDLVDMPHILVAGTTGSGKSVGLTSMINGLIVAKAPRDLGLILIDPKMVELTAYRGLPHLMTDVLTTAEQALEVLLRLIEEMNKRYAMLEDLHCQNIADLPASLELPRLVVVIDELADLILSPIGKDIEEALIRLAQKSRAAGIHIIAATQRPVVRVVTGLIKANFPARMAFRVAAEVDSKVILDQSGAEDLLGKGDMLFLAPGYPQPIRVQGALTSPERTRSLVAWAKQTYPPPAKYVAPVEVTPEPVDPLFWKKVYVICGLSFWAIVLIALFSWL
jgi:S-DNA-T family DNA segregation ATPase FtsK/SpoIIIE